MGATAQEVFVAIKDALAEVQRGRSAAVRNARLLDERRTPELLQVLSAEGYELVRERCYVGVRPASSLTLGISNLLGEAGLPHRWHGPIGIPTVWVFPADTSEAVRRRLSQLVLTWPVRS